MCLGKSALLSGVECAEVRSAACGRMCEATPWFEEWFDGECVSEVRIEPLINCNADV